MHTIHFSVCEICYGSERDEKRRHTNCIEYLLHKSPISGYVSGCACLRICASYNISIHIEEKCKKRKSWRFITHSNVYRLHKQLIFDTIHRHIHMNATHVYTENLIYACTEKSYIHFNTSRFVSKIMFADRF